MKPISKNSGDYGMTETMIDVICFLREKGKFDNEARDLAVKLIDLFILTPKGTDNE